MFLILGSTVVFIASIFVYTKSRKYFSTLASKVTMEIKYSLLGVRENIMDVINSKHNKTDLPRKTGCVAIVTGGSRGIGAVVVKMLLQCDMDVIIACRKIDAGGKAIRKIRESGTTTGNASVYHLDNSNLQSVRKFAEDMKLKFNNIHILINNAGIMFPPYGETQDGFEQQWAVNYLSHFLLTAMLMPQLRNAGSQDSFSRVINVSSCAHLLGNTNFKDINDRHSYIANRAYAQSKLAQVIFTKSLEKIARQNDLPIHSYAVHPGIVNTDLFEHSFLRKLSLIRKLFFKTPEQGATGIVYAAVSQKIADDGGAYLSNCLEVPVNPIANDPSVQENLLALSLEQTKLDNFLQYL